MNLNQIYFASNFIRYYDLSIAERLGKYLKIRNAYNVKRTILKIIIIRVRFFIRQRISMKII